MRSSAEPPADGARAGCAACRSRSSTPARSTSQRSRPSRPLRSGPARVQPPCVRSATQRRLGACAVEAERCWTPQEGLGAQAMPPRPAWADLPSLHMVFCLPRVPGPIAAPAPRCCRAWRADKQGARGAQDTTLRELAEGWVTLELWCGEERAAIARVKTLEVPQPPPPARARRLRAASVPLLAWHRP